MLAIDITGPDNTGKDHVAAAIEARYDVELVHCSDLSHCSSSVISALGAAFRALASFGERHGSKLTTIVGYVGNTVLYRFAKQRNTKPVIYVRYPPVDYDVYRDEYIGAAGPFQGAADWIMRRIIGHSGTLDAVIYLYADAGALVARGQGQDMQLHDSRETFERLLARYSLVVSGLHAQGANVFSVDTTRMTLDEVIAHVTGIVEPMLAAYRK